ncbi:MAG: DUF6114 domain-containing protein [Candidatus Bathyarchaeota archaeon]|nr:DUF6114 domain-containing protein [Candidatus Bathyarchaeota archaeon]
MVKEMSSIAFLLSLIGGVLIFVAGLVSSVWFLFGGTVWGGFSDMWSGFMGGYHGMMGSFGFPLGFMAGFSLVGLVSGVMVIVSALMLNFRSHERFAWSVLIMVFSAVSFLNMGGFFIGGLLGLAGGAMAFGSKI